MPTDATQYINFPHAPSLVIYPSGQKLTLAIKIISPSTLLLTTKSKRQVKKIYITETENSPFKTLDFDLTGGMPKSACCLPHACVGML